MNIACPYCSYEINIRTPKVGNFKPKCPKCQHFVVLTIQQEHGQFLVEIAKIDIPEGMTEVKNRSEREIQYAKSADNRIPDTSAHENLSQAIAPKPEMPTQHMPEHLQEESPFNQDQVEQKNENGSEIAKKLESPKKSAASFEMTIDSIAVTPEKVKNSLHSAKNQEKNARPTEIARGRKESKAKLENKLDKKESTEDLPKRLGGYEVIKEIGRGGMGAVYLGRQISLDRLVALKVRNPSWGDDPIFLARFTREAYVAAQLVHHHVVQIYDIGYEKNIHFFSMEFVDGQNLGELVKKRGRIAAEEAVGYILQAARGLKFAHEFGMIHRDIKPDNLMLNNQGMVKIADLGLVKTPIPISDYLKNEVQEKREEKEYSLMRESMERLKSLPSNLTLAFSAMGSPSYMSPEQCRDASTVDHRADIYSLGCTLYVLVTGRTPFSGATAYEVMTKHVSENVIPPDKIVEEVPQSLSDILLKMMAKSPAERYQSMQEVISDLEDWLKKNKQDLSNQILDESQRQREIDFDEESLALLEACVSRFNDSRLVKKRREIIVGGAVLWTILFFLSFMVGDWFVAGLVSLLVHSLLSIFVLQGMTGRSIVFNKVRETILGASWSDWGIGVLSIMLFTTILVTTHFIWSWLVFAAAGIGLGFWYRQQIDRKLIQIRQPVIEEIESMNRRLRMQGMNEDKLRLRTAQFSGKDWEECYEWLFGFEDKLVLRYQLDEQSESLPRNRFGVWREYVIDWLNAIQLKRTRKREAALLRKLEAKKFEREGMSSAEARNQAQILAEGMVDQVAQLKEQQGRILKPRRKRVPFVSSESYGPSSLSSDMPRSNVPSPNAYSTEKTKANTPEQTRASFEGKIDRFEMEPVHPTRPITVKQILHAAEKPAKKIVKKRIDPFAFLMEFIFGWKLRFLVSVFLLSLGSLWFYQYFYGQLGLGLEGDEARFARIIKIMFDQKEPMELKTTFLPEVITSYFDYVNPLVAGLLLFISLFYSGDFMSFMLLVSAGIIMLGHRFGLPSIGPLKAYVVAMAIGGGMAIVGIIMARRQR